MLHDLKSILWSTTKTLLWISDKDLLQEILALWSDVLWQFDVTFPDVIKELFLVVIVQAERRLTCQHLKDNTANGPPIDSSSMSLSVHDLWSEVLWCTAKCCRILVRLDVFLREAEICKLRVSISVNQYILWLKTKIKFNN